VLSSESGGKKSNARDESALSNLPSFGKGLKIFEFSLGLRFRISIALTYEEADKEEE
jgi:hypothetical protein